ncbi:hypothetical protein ACWCPQ_33705 [Nocardia sp. NPDC001965]
MKRITARDQLFLEWLTQQYGTPVDVVGDWYSVRKSRAYEIVQKLGGMGKIERVQAHVDAPGSKQGPLWVIPTRSTAHAMLGSDPGPWTVRPSTAAHVRALAELRLALTGTTTNPEAWRSERLLRRAAADTSGQRDIAAPVPYCHDAVFTDDSGKSWAVECELSVKKGAGRMESTLLTSLEAAKLLQDQATGTPVSGVIYFCRGEQVRGHVERAIERLKAEHGPDRVKGLHVRDLDQILRGRRVRS